MTIGENLKFWRLRTGKTQKEWIGDLMSESFYSKVERDVHSIDADLLIKLLERNQLDIATFLKNVKVKKTVDPDYLLKRKIKLYQNEKNLAGLNQIKAEIKAKHHGKIEPYITRRGLEIAYLWVTHSDKYVSKETKERTKNFFAHEDKWDSATYSTLAQVIILFDLEEQKNIIHSALSVFDKKTRGEDDFIFINVLISNYLNCLYYQKADWSYYKEPIEFIFDLGNVPETASARILATYYKALYYHDWETADEIIDISKMSGMYPWIEDTDPHNKK